MNTWFASARRGARTAFAAAALLTLSHAWGGDFEYQASAGLGYTDNPRLVASGGNSLENSNETIATVGTKFSFDQYSKRLQADVVGDVAYHKYLNDTFDSQLVGNVFANGSLALVPERFIWTATDQFGQVLGDPFLPATAENSENINFFSTGPDFYVGLGSQMRLRLGARYSLTDYEIHPLDMTSTAGEAALIRVISERKQVSLNARVEQVEYDEQQFDADFDQVEAYVRYSATGARTNLSADVGFSTLDRESRPEDESGALIRLQMSRLITTSSTLSLTGGRQFSTAAGAFISEQGIANTGLGSTPGRQTADPFTNDSMILGWQFNRNRTGVTVNASWSQRSYEDIPAFDVTMSALSAGYERDLSARTSMEISTSFTSADYKTPSPDYDDFTAGLAFRWHVSRSLSFNAEYDFAKRDSDIPSANYQENRLWLTLAYGHGEPRRTRVAPTFGIETTSGQGN